MSMYRPWMERRFGVEMELTESRGSSTQRIYEEHIRSAMEVQGVEPNDRGASYYHSNGDTWDIKTDSSCGWELASPALYLNENGDNHDLKAVCRALQSLDPVVDRRCGLHVHVEVTDFNWQDLRRLLALWVRYEPFFYELMPVSRRSNSFCTPLRTRRWEQGYEGTVWTSVTMALESTREETFNRHLRQWGRYTVLNVTPWFNNRRVEFRLHSGTVNYTKVKHWMMLISALVNRVKMDSMPQITPGSTAASPGVGFDTPYICKQLGLLPSRAVPEVPEESLKLVSWLDARRKQFTPEVEGRYARSAANPPVGQVA